MGDACGGGGATGQKLSWGLVGRNLVLCATLAIGLAELLEDGVGEEDAVGDGEGSGGLGGVLDEGGGFVVVADVGEIGDHEALDALALEPTSQGRFADLYVEFLAQPEDGVPERGGLAVGVRGLFLGGGKTLHVRI